MKDIQKEAEILGLVVDILDYINEQKINLTDLSDVNKIIPKKTTKKAFFKILDIKQGQQLLITTEEKEIVTCLVLVGNIIIGEQLLRLKRYDSGIFNNDVFSDFPCQIPTRATCQSKVLFIATN